MCFENLLGKVIYFFFKKNNYNYNFLYLISITYNLIFTLSGIAAISR